jgi:hypothetical protein
MICERCKELELRYLGQTEGYIGFIERQSRMFRNGEIQSGRDLDGAVVAARTAMYDGLRAWAAHRESYAKAIRA